MNLAAEPLKTETLMAAVDVLQRSFRPVAERLGITPENYPTHPAFQEARQFVHYLNRESVIVYLFADGVNLVGVGGWSMARKDLGSAWLKRIAVVPEQQRRGYGAQIVQYVEERMREHGFTKSVLLCSSADAPLLRFYEAQGYTPSSTTGAGVKRYTRMWKAL